MATNIVRKPIFFRELNDKQDIKLDEPGTYFFGLTTEGILCSETDEDVLCVKLFQVTLQFDGGCLLAPINRDLTCVVNSTEDLKQEMNLVHGTKIEIAEKKIVFNNSGVQRDRPSTLRTTPRKRRQLPRTPGQSRDPAPPPKPARAGGQNGGNNEGHKLPVVRTIESLLGTSKPGHVWERVNSGVQRDRPSTLRTTPRKRRQLPRTPGQSRDPAPPPKPARSRGQNGGNDEGHTLPVVQTTEATDESSDEEDEKKWLSHSFVMVDLPTDQQDKLKDLTTPEQISVLAASYFTKQLRMFTDAVVTGQLIDDIFRLFMDTIGDCHDAFMMYLSSVSNALAKSPDRSHHSPLHRPAVRLATELLRNGFDPISRVILILNLLRTFSHFEKNIPAMVRYQTPASVIGSMTACKTTMEVQHYGLEILSKVATYKPELGEKPPLKEVGIEQVIRGTKQHPDSVDIGRAACRVFANLSSTVISLLNSWIDSGRITDDEKFKSLERMEQLQEFIFTEGIPVAQTIVNTFNEDLALKMEFRRFVFFYANHQHYKVKKEKWLSQQNHQFETSMKDSGVCILTNSQNFSTSTVQNNSLTNGYNSKQGFKSARDSSSKTMDEPSDLPSNSTKDSGKTCDPMENIEDGLENVPAQGILKKSRSFECLKTSQRKLKFDAETVGGSASTSSQSESDSDSSYLEFEGPFEPKVPGELDIEEDFSFDLVKHLVKKSVKRRKSFKKHPHYTDSSSSDTDDSDKEFLHSVNITAKSKVTKVYHPENKTATNSEKKGVGNDKDPPNEKLNSREGDSRGTHDNNAEANNNTMDKVVGASDASVDMKMPNGHQMGKNGGNGAAHHHGSPRPDHLGAAQQQTQGQRNSEDVDVYFMAKLVQTQVTVYVITMVFQEQDTQVLQIIDQPVKKLLEEAGASQPLLSFAGTQYGDNMTLMDLEPGLVISIIDAVRYRDVAIQLLHSTLLSLTRALSNSLQLSTVDITMDFFRLLFSDTNLQQPLSDKEFLKEFRQCFHSATSRLSRSNSVEEMRKNLQTNNFVV